MVCVTLLKQRIPEKQYIQASILQRFLDLKSLEFAILNEIPKSQSR
jgi:hypothetical protein